MKSLYHRLPLLIAGATQQELARHVRDLKTENRILRSKLSKRVPVTLKEQNRLVKFGAKLGQAIGELATLVHPDTLRRWIRESTAAFLEHVRESGLGTSLVMHDRDTKFSRSFDDVLKTGGVRVQKAAPRSLNTCAFVERFIQTLQQECLDYLVVFGEKHMNHLVSEMVAPLPRGTAASGEGAADTRISETDKSEEGIRADRQYPLSATVGWVAEVRQPEGSVTPIPHQTHSPQFPALSWIASLASTVSSIHIGL